MKDTAPDTAQSALRYDDLVKADCVTRQKITLLPKCADGAAARLSTPGETEDARSLEILNRHVRGTVH